MTPDERLGLNIRRRRISLGLSQQRLAERTEIARSTLSLYENGRREVKLGALVRLTGVLGVSVEDLQEGVTWDEERGEFVVEEDDR
jgi:transcriptional regulator with XRE-family HTH domain